MILQEEGGQLTGRFQRGESGQWLAIENGRVSGSNASWTVKRDRPDGANMIYEMSGSLENGAMTGKAKTRLDGNDITIDWSAKRK